MSEQSLSMGASAALGTGVAEVPRPPGKRRRVLAWLVDFTLVVTVAVLLAALTADRIGALTTDATGPAGRGAWEIVTSHGELAGTAGDFGTSIWSSVVRDVQEAFAALVLATFVYQFLTLALTGRTLGKLLLGLRVSGTAPGRLGRRRAAVRAAVTTAADVGCFAVACCVLVDGSLVLSVLCWAVAVAVFWANALPVLVGRGRSLADRLAGTAVVTVTLPRPDWAGAQQGVRQAVDLGRAGARGSQAAWGTVVRGAQDGGQRIARHDAVRRVVDSEASRAAADRGRAALDRARAAAARRRPGTPPPPPFSPPHPTSAPPPPPLSPPHTVPAPPPPPFSPPHAAPAPPAAPANASDVGHQAASDPAEDSRP
ncbi:RDD family protein [Streptomyces sp. B3I8]|uniref:RDD family protein n=1 Tax=Streptomyces sp. B3I8 TaxID=3042303 RepID=UPI0027850EC6|nr:RDD family protein [Streptomyces sp. B3I8]MDQ0789977.1 putative RDD family membrane protein YckC [Streptomyces sp. B3I8]